VSEEVETIIFVALVIQEGMDLRNFLSNFEAKDMAEIEHIGKLERETIGSKMKETVMEEKWNHPSFS